MKDLFSPDEFAKISGTTIHEDHCNYVNQKLNKLIESWPVVYDGNSGWGNFPIESWGLVKHDEKDHIAISSNFKNSRRKARLAFIEDISKQPCKHEPRHSILGEKAEDTYLGYRCKHCGVELEASWSEKK